LEIIHLSADAIFATVGISESGSMLSLSYQRGDFIILERTNSSNTEHRNPQHKGQWYVSMEVHMPSPLSKLNILQVLFVDMPVATEKTEQVTASTDSKYGSPDAASKGTTMQNLSVDDPSSTKPPCTHLIVLLESGVISSLQLCPSVDDEHVKLHEIEEEETEDELMAQLVRMNWEFLLGM
jgi:hypothetical protein